MMSDKLRAAALAALEMLSEDDRNAEKCIRILKAALAEPEQEPVEWGVDWGPDGNSVSIIKRLAGGGIEVVGWEYAPHPPQRPWVGLTDEEIWTLHDSYLNPVEFAQAIEAKLREKNG